MDYDAMAVAIAKAFQQLPPMRVSVDDIHAGLLRKRQRSSPLFGSYVVGERGPEIFTPRKTNSGVSDVGHD